MPNVGRRLPQIPRINWRLVRQAPGMIPSSARKTASPPIVGIVEAEVSSLRGANP